MSTQKYDRFKAAPWFQEDKKPPVLVGGAGGIGSWLTLLLNRAGFETYVFDFDLLEEINMAGQLFMHKSITMPKVDALADLVREICREEIIPNREMMDKTTMTNDIVFSAFDNMKARRDIFETWRETNKGSKTAIFIDGRLTMEQLTIFCVRANNPVELEEYDKVHLFDDSKVPDMDCTAKQTSHGAAMIAAKMVAKFTNWYCGILDPEEERPCAFFWQHYIPAEYTFQREANAIEEAQVAMQEDVLITPQELVESSPNIAAFEESQELLEQKNALKLFKELLTNWRDITSDLPGTDGTEFNLILEQDRMGTWRFGEGNRTEVLTLDEARERASLLNLEREFEAVLSNYSASNEDAPNAVTWLAERIPLGSGSDQITSEEEVELRDIGGSAILEAGLTQTVPPEDPEEEEEEIFDHSEEEVLDETPDPPDLDINSINVSITNPNITWATITDVFQSTGNIVADINPYLPEPPDPYREADQTYPSSSSAT